MAPYVHSTFLISAREVWGRADDLSLVLVVVLVVLVVVLVPPPRLKLGGLSPPQTPPDSYKRLLDS